MMPEMREINETIKPELRAKPEMRGVLFRLFPSFQASFNFRFFLGVERVDSRLELDSSEKVALIHSSQKKKIEFFH